MITITGELFDGRKFKGMDMIRVISQKLNIDGLNALLFITQLII